MVDVTTECAEPGTEAAGDSTMKRYVTVGGQRIRVDIRAGSGVPLVLCNGIGTSLELMDPLVAHLDPQTTIVRFDVPGTGDSPTPTLPYRFSYLAWELGQVLTELGMDVVDVLGLSWGGALAQQFAFQNPRRCRRLVLAATGIGVLTVPGHLRVLTEMLTPRRFSDPDYLSSIAGELYGGTARQNGGEVAKTFGAQLPHVSHIGYLYQLLARSTWTSLFKLPTIQQPTLVVAGTDDPIIPMINARILTRLLPRATLHQHGGGHVDLITNAAELAPVIDEFLHTPTQMEACQEAS